MNWHLAWTMYSWVVSPILRSVQLQVLLPQNSDVRIQIYNVLGQSLKMLTTFAVHAGKHILTWDGTTDAGKRIAPGIYFARLELPASARIQRIIAIH